MCHFTLVTSSFKRGTFWSPDSEEESENLLLLLAIDQYLIILSYGLRIIFSNIWQLYTCDIQSESLSFMLTLCDPIDYTVHGIIQARTLEWVTFPFFRGSSQPGDWTQVSRITSDSLSAEPPAKPKPPQTYGRILQLKLQPGAEWPRKASWPLSTMMWEIIVFIKLA